MTFDTTQIFAIQITVTMRYSQWQVPNALFCDVRISNSTPYSTGYGENFTYTFL